MALNLSKLHMIPDARTIEEKLDCVARGGNLSDIEELLKRIFWALDIDEPKQKADNLVLFGCYNVYRLPLSVARYLRLLELVGVDYTYLTKEYCCGFPLLEQAVVTGRKAEDVQELEQKCREFMLRNIRAGRERGAKEIHYFCVWCAHLAKKLFPEDVGQHYFPDILLEKLQDRHLRVKPSVVGYYEGCHLRNRLRTPGIDLDWAGYRKFLGNIEGLRVVDMNRKTCCVVNPYKVVEEAEKLNLDTIICSCPACQIRLADIGKGRVQTRFLPDLLLDALAPGTSILRD